MVTRNMLSLKLGLDPDVDTDLLDVLNATGSDSITYAEFVANVLHLSFRTVELYYYDLSKNFASVLSPVLLGQYEEGIWHTSVGVFGQEPSSNTTSHCVHAVPLSGYATRRHFSRRMSVGCSSCLESVIMSP